MYRSSTLLFTAICLGFITGLLAQVPEQEAELGSQATLQCTEKIGFRDCTWSMDTDTSLILKSTYPDLYPEGYSLNFDANAGTCALQIVAVKAENMGKWSCVLDISRNDVKLIVTKRPEENNLKYNEQVVNNGASMGVVLDAEKKAQVTCESKLGLPQPLITWRVNNQNALDEDVTYTVEGGSSTDGFHVKSALTLKYPAEEQPMGYARAPDRNPDLQKEVYCTIKYSTDEAKAIELHAIFGEEIATSDAVLEVLLGSHDKERILRCEANGIPNPDYQIVRTAPNPAETGAPLAQNRTVTVEGTYICKAGNLLNTQKHESKPITVDFGKGIEDKTEKNKANIDTAETGTIVGIVVGALVLLALIGGITMFTFKKRKLCFKGVEGGETAARTAENGTSHQPKPEEKRMVSDKKDQSAQDAVNSTPHH